MADYRELPEADRVTFAEYIQYAFQAERGPRSIDIEDDVVQIQTEQPGTARALYPESADEDADPLCVCLHYWLDARVRGDVHHAPGLAMVASPPENRHGGHVATMLRESLREYRERDARFSILWPFEYPFYRKYGWDTTNQRVSYECEPSALAFASDAPIDVEYRRVTPDDAAALEPIYRADAEGIGLTIQRSTEWWQYRVFGDYQGKRYGYVVSVDGRDCGYLTYRVHEHEGEYTLRVRELAAVDHEGLLAILAFCHRHDAQVDTLELQTHPRTDLLDLVPEPERVTATVSQGPMVRIVDVAETLSALSYPAVDERVVVDVEDPLVDWNDGRFALDVASGGGDCEATDAEAGVSTDVGTLSQLAVGYRSARELASVGRLSGDDAAIAALGRVFPEQPVYLREHF